MKLNKRTVILIGIGAAIAYWYWRKQQALYAVMPGAGAAASSSGAVSGLGDGADPMYRMGDPGDPMYPVERGLYGLGIDKYTMAPKPYKPPIVRYPTPVVRMNDDNWSN